MGATASQITSLTIVESTFTQAQIKENIKAQRHWPLCGNSPVTSEWPVTRKMLPFDDVIMCYRFVYDWPFHNILQFTCRGRDAHAYSKIIIAGWINVIPCYFIYLYIILFLCHALVEDSIQCTARDYRSNHNRRWGSLAYNWYIKLLMVK